MASDVMFGYAMAVGCALAWSVAIIMFKKVGDIVHPVVLNLTKNTVGLVLFIPTLWWVEGSLQFDIPAKELTLMIVSGFLGIGVADFLILKALSHLGASRLAILECLYSPFVIMFSLLFLGEQMTAAKGAGTLLVIAAIISVTARKAIIPGPGENIAAGTLWGAIGLFVMAIGIAIMKPLFATLPLVLIVTVRLAAGVLASYAIYFFTPDRKMHRDRLLQSDAKGFVLFASILSTYIAMIMWVAGFKYNDAMVAAVLNQTSTIFTVMLAVIFLKERLTVAKIVGAVLAMAGVVIMAS